MEDTKQKNINSFVGEYAFLSLEYPCEFIMNGIKFKSASAAFYAQKNTDINSWQKFARLNPNKARQKAATLPITDEYINNKYNYLYNAVKAKFDCNPDLKKKLCDTGDKKLINNVTYNDEWIGVRANSGKNKLGKVLMQIRSEYLEKDQKD